MLILNIYSCHLQEQLNFRALTLGKLHSPPVVTHLSPTDASDQLCSLTDSSPALFKDITQHYLKQSSSLVSSGDLEPTSLP